MLLSIYQIFKKGNNFKNTILFIKNNLCNAGFNGKFGFDDFRITKYITNYITKKK